MRWQRKRRPAGEALVEAPADRGALVRVLAQRAKESRARVLTETELASMSKLAERKNKPVATLAYELMAKGFKALH